MATITGSAGADSLTGTTGDDFLVGGGGADTLSDYLGGSDSFYGGDGDDFIPVSRGYAATGGGSLLIDGGAGDDTVGFNTSFGERGVSAAISLGDGDDRLFVQDSAHFAVDAGSGNDDLDISVSTAVDDASYRVALGPGSDNVELAVYPQSTGAVIFTDFQIGEDFLDLQDFLAFSLRNWDHETNPFATGHLRLTAFPLGSLVQVDYDGGGDTWRTIATLPEQPSAFATAGLSGWLANGAPPVGETLQGGGGSDHLRGGPGDDRIEGGASQDFLYGGLGDDTLIGGPGGDSFDGGEGFNTVSYENATGPVGIALTSVGDYHSAAQTGDAADYSNGQTHYDGFYRIQAFVFSRFADRIDFSDWSGSDFQHPDRGLRIDAGDGADAVTGSRLADIIHAGAGDDTLTGGPGGDVLDGGEGTNLLRYLGFAHDYALTLVGGNGSVVHVREAGTDTVSNIQSIAFKDGQLTFDDGSTAAQVVRLYDSFLGRTPDAAGFNSYLKFVKAGHSFRDMADNAAASTEFRDATAGLSDKDYITYVYAHSLHRTPDQGGLQNYLDALHSGALTRTSMIVQAAESPEHVALTASIVAQGLWLPNEKVEALELLYDASVQRQPDPTGIADYSAELAAGTSFRQIANQMAGSAEFQAAHGAQSDAQYVDSLYVAEVWRHADPAGLAAYIEQLAHGFTRGDVLYETAMSQEHQSHVLAYFDPLLIGA